MFLISSSSTFETTTSNSTPDADRRDRRDWLADANIIGFSVFNIFTFLDIYIFFLFIFYLFLLNLFMDTFFYIVTIVKKIKNILKIFHLQQTSKRI